MRQKRGVRIGWGLLLTLLLTGAIVTPVWAANSSTQRTVRHRDATTLNATIYMTTATLQPLFQQRINQQVPGIVNSAITGIVNKMPQANRGWAQQMATTLIQPSATMTGLTPQQDGLATSIHLSLYPGDPKPVDASMLVKFSVLNSSTIQVSAQPTNGSPTLVNGPLTTLQVPVGQLTGISATPDCGDAALAVKLDVPVSLNQAQSALQNSSGTAHGTAVMKVQQAQAKHAPQDTVNTYVEIPGSALSSLGDSVGSLPIDQTFTANNIHVNIQGGNLVITSDIMLGSSSVRLATATSYMQPTTAGGNLAVQVVKTNVTIFSMITFKYDTYNKQIEQTLNSKLNGMLAGKFNITDAVIGSNTHLPCVADDSLLLTGTTSLG